MYLSVKIAIDFEVLMGIVFPKMLENVTQDMIQDMILAFEWGFFKSIDVSRKSK